MEADTVWCATAHGTVPSSDPPHRNRSDGISGLTVLYPPGDSAKAMTLDHLALALDERRVKFLPEYAWGGTTLPPEPGMPGVSHHDRARPHTLEVWFPGTHSDMYVCLSHAFFFPYLTITSLAEEVETQTMPRWTVVDHL